MVHWVAVLVSALYVLEGQAAQDPALFPAASQPLSTSPAPQLVQALQAATVPVVPLNVPLSQLTQESAERLSPAPHSLVQLPPLGPSQPLSHFQAVRDVLPVAPFVVV